MSVSTLTRKERRSAIIGMVLGDGSLSRSRYMVGQHGGNAILRIAHNVKQRDYLAWKRDIIQPMFGYPLTLQDKYATATWKGVKKSYPVTWLVTRVNPQLTHLHTLIYSGEGGRKRVTPEILEMLDDRAVAIWYMDDGCLSLTEAGGGQVKLATNNFTLAENELIRDWFTARYEVTFNIHRHKTGTYSLSRGISEAHKLIDAIAPYVVPPMRYKVEYPQSQRSGGWYELSRTVPSPA